ncbi:ABC transporter permease [Virgibacillus sp. 179-BFC.A HS]|uniref:ABC transporter permease n=1 Tax=Tigheibacillus jepli TaxID=3035914 RepID=A0ABU5CGF9_9BACI|nr:ABC transporter permease [Virgibacillus sp. 179-BFC.A HS]MDY0405390.1 ABC transporter permease [Virgibacillus sp. 179-BFC.A HS]
MKSILQTRWLHWKKQAAGLLFWLLLPIVGSILIHTLFQGFQQQTKVPVGMVMEEKSPMAMKLLHDIKHSPTLQVQVMDEAEALHLLEIHKLDSVFVLHSGYEEEIRNGNRDELLTGYRSNLSIAYTPVKEMIVSLVQEETSRSKAAYTIKGIADAAGKKQQWTWDEIVDTSNRIEKEENLLLTTFSFLPAADSLKPQEKTTLDIWAIWVLLHTLVSFFLMDWIIKEKQSGVFVRFSFMRYSYRQYLLGNALLYFFLLYIFDLIVAVVFHVVLQTSFSLYTPVILFALQLMLTSAGFLLALLFKHSFTFYSVSFAVVLMMTLASGSSILPGAFGSSSAWFLRLNPLQNFLHGGINYSFPAFCLLLITGWYFSKRKSIY